MGKRRQRGSSEAVAVRDDGEPAGLIKPDSCALNALPPKRRAFVLCYCGLQGDPRQAWNGAAAARAAGYTQNTSERWAYELLRDPAVKAAVDEVLVDLRQRHEALAQRAVDELTAAAFARVADVVDTSSGYVRLKDLPPDDPAWAAVASVEQGEHGVKVKLHPKAQLVGTLLRAIGYMQDARGPAVNVVQVGQQSDAGLYTAEAQRRVRELLGIRTTIDVEPGE